jgi:pyruvate/2-oxoglutarate dehydrogenase complex dihydrolipoamide acyltransferase (E2) component
MDLIGKHEEKPFPSNRRFLIDGLIAGVNKSPVYGLLELDVTRGRERLRQYRMESGKYVSFTGWIIKCIAQAVSEQPNIQTYRHGWRRMVTFEDVDVSTIIERQIEGVSINFPSVIRKANTKTIEEISAEIKSVKDEKLRDSTFVLGEKRTLMETIGRWAPTFARRLFWRYMKRNAYLTKKTMGTVGVTSLSSFSGTSGYIISNSIHNLTFGLGSVTRKPGVIGDNVEIRQYLCMTVIANHEVIDGAPLARFISRLTELIETQFGLTI